MKKKILITLIIASLFLSCVSLGGDNLKMIKECKGGEVCQEQNLENYRKASIDIQNYFKNAVKDCKNEVPALPKEIQGIDFETDLKNVEIYREWYSTQLESFKNLKKKCENWIV